MNVGFALKWWRRWRFDWYRTPRAWIFLLFTPLVPVCCTRPGHFLLYLIKMFICTRKMQSSLSIYLASFLSFFFFGFWFVGGVGGGVQCLVWHFLSFFLFLLFDSNKCLHHTCWHNFFQQLSSQQTKGSSVVCVCERSNRWGNSLDNVAVEFVSVPFGHCRHICSA